MSYQDKIKEAEDKISKAEHRIKSAEKKKDDCLVRLAKCRRAVSAPDEKKKGNLWLIAGVILISVEIVLLIIGFPFQVTDILIIAAVLAIGGYRKFAGLGAYTEALGEFGSVEEAMAQRDQLHKELCKHEGEVKAAEKALKDAQNEKESLTKYYGKDWDLRYFTATPENVAAMEKDAENLFIAVQYIAGNNNIIANWMCRGRMELFQARLTQDKSLEEAVNRGFTAMGESGSWKLEIVQMLLSSLDLALLSASFGGDTGMRLHELMKKSSVRGPETEDEQEFYDLAVTASIIMAGTLEYVVKQNMGKR